MNNFVPGMPSKLPKCSLAEQEAEIEAWTAKKGNKVTHLPNTQSTPRPTHRVKKEPDSIAMKKARRIVSRIRTSRLGLTHEQFIAILDGQISSATIRRLIKDEFGLELVCVKHLTSTDKTIIKMGLKK